MKFPILAPLLLLFVLQSAEAAPDREIGWQPWSPQLFQQAKGEKKFVFLYLEAVWCHWCHVMQEQTFTDPNVRAALARNYVVTKVDHDANPFLAGRYRDYGWPALIFFAPDGTEIVKRAGFIAPAEFAHLLAAIVADPRPEGDAPASDAAGASSLSMAQRKALLEKHRDSYDGHLGGLNSPQKFIDRDSVEYALFHADDAVERGKVEKTLGAATSLLDPVWGGAYQYSTGGDWQNPHYEKIMRVQAGYLRIYSLAYGKLRREQDRVAASSIRDYLFHFLRSPDGAFYVSQDADLVPGQKAADYFALDDAGRRQRGVPRVDQHLYADANGRAAEALAIHYQFTGDEQSLAAAILAAEWTLKHRQTKGGGFRHGAGEKSEPFYLSDNLAMGEAFLQLYKVTADRVWLMRAQATAKFIETKFRSASAGLLTASAAVGPLQPTPVLEENIAAVRFLNLSAQYTGDPSLRELAEHTMKFLANDTRIAESFEEAGILLADEELSASPAHLTVVGGKRDAVARELFVAALHAPGAYTRIEWLDATEGPLPNSDVQYPKFPRAAGYVCQNRRCSAPRFTAVDFSAAIESSAKSSK